MSLPKPPLETAPMAVTEEDVRPIDKPKPTSRAIDILATLRGPSSSNHRPIDLLDSLRHPPSLTAASSDHKPPSRTRPMDLLAELKARSPLCSTSSVPPDTHTESAPQRPVDILATIRRQTARQLPPSTLNKPTGSGLPPPDASFNSSSIASRPMAPLPKRAVVASSSSSTVPKPRRHHGLPKPTIQKGDVEMNLSPNFVDLTIEHPRDHLPDIIELTDESDVDMDSTPLHHPEDINMRPVDFVFNTNLPVNPRHTARPWVGSLRPQDWIPSREELHAAQVDFDRSLPSEMHLAGFPVYVRLSSSQF
jgi:hypothetical protein